MFVGAALLFWVQPLFTKMVLPLLGGSPSVWNTAMVFFQAALLCGYGYAHLLTRHLGPRGQCLTHLCVLGAAAVALPIGIAEGWRPDSDAPPALWLLGLLVVSIRAVLRRRHHSTADPTLVFPHAPPARIRSLFPVRREQSRQRCRPACVSVRDRAAGWDARASVWVDARIPSPGRLYRRVRCQRVGQFRQDQAGNSIERCSATDLAPSGKLVGV